MHLKISSCILPTPQWVKHKTENYICKKCKEKSNLSTDQSSIQSLLNYNCVWSANGFLVFASLFDSVMATMDEDLRCVRQGVIYCPFQLHPFVYAQLCKHLVLKSSIQWRHNQRDGVSNHPLFPQPFIQAQIKGNIKATRHLPLCAEFTSDRWIPRRWPVTRKMCPFDDVIMPSSIMRYLK